MDYNLLAENIKAWGLDLGFQQVGICDIDLKSREKPLQDWLNSGYHGDMDWMARHGMMRARPDELLPGTVRVISARMNYLPPEAQFATNLSDASQAYISRYALGRDYHKLVRNQLKKLGQKIEQEVGKLGFRPFVDSAPILERPLAEKAGLGWIGKHSLLLDANAGSWFFLGELQVDIPLPIDQPVEAQCGKCTACITSCPTNAILSPGVVDARLCISYLTIEFDGIIPEALRSKLGNRIYGCDDCQLVCPWNRQANITEQHDFHRREHFTTPDLLTLFMWSEGEFMKKLEGSPIRRIGHLQWRRNIAVALGNAPYQKTVIETLSRYLGISDLLDVHITWSIAQQESRKELIAAPSAKEKRLIRIIQKGLPRDA
ncbi:MAG: tRNA epoxyqueuosine(34) reductase QueG [Aliivibrio sp.]|uniref:tRNA epoxyqueuosine(34) reductase QueG n=1 Tax=Aliivibrio sp. TaxID=1872443 RepID=UPI001A3BFB3F|nr:tRNA epoxyqueuosine(34) reductase QueG [Aliivibrio sp.]